MSPGVSQCACSSLFWLICSCRPAFLFSSGYVTRWHPASTPPGPVTLNVNTCLFPPQVQWHSQCFEVRPCQQALSCTPFLFICGAKAAHTWDFFTSGKARAWSSFVLLAYRKRFFYCLTLIVYKMVKVRLQRPSIKHHQLRIWLVKNRKSTRVWTHGGLHGVVEAVIMHGGSTF